MELWYFMSPENGNVMFRLILYTYFHKPGIMKYFQLFSTWRNWVVDRIVGVHICYSVLIKLKFKEFSGISHVTTVVTVFYWVRNVLNQLNNCLLCSLVQGPVGGCSAVQEIPHFWEAPDHLTLFLREPFYIFSLPIFVVVSRELSFYHLRSTILCAFLVSVMRAACPHFSLLDSV